MNTHSRALGLLNIIAWSCLGLLGCQSTPHVPIELERQIVLDGDIGEWDDAEAAWGNEHYLYLRFTVEGEQFSLQAGPKTVAVYLDADGDPNTGQAYTDGPLAGMGIDFEAQFSPRRERGPGRGVAVWTLDASGARTAQKPSAFDIAIAPTYASSWYEMRISRTPDGAPLPPRGLCGEGPVRGLVGVLAADGSIEAWTDRFDIAPGRVCEGGKELSTVFLPSKPAKGLRVISWNIERSAPTTNPDPFRRILTALQPDILLLQEWDTGDAAGVQTWLAAAGFPEWHVRKTDGDLSNGGGVLVASRYPIDPLGGTLSAEGGGIVRLAAGLVRTPLGDLAAASVHLKCCGAKDSSEDRKRMSEARAINALLNATLAGGKASMRVIAGDMNLVGSRPPLDLLRAGIDADGSDLVIADAKVMGDLTYTTWRDGGTEFPPGRLDYVLYSDASLEAAHAFVFDSARLTSIALDAAGVRADDSAASDHCPVVVDLVPIR
ncbi:MAG: endonuclease [Phycisphaerae bacterium]|nr:MAG: endonuclease [Phycisphaerae bacterium]